MGPEPSPTTSRFVYSRGGGRGALTWLRGRGGRRPRRRRRRRQLRLHSAGVAAAGTAASLLSDELSAAPPSPRNPLLLPPPHVRWSSKSESTMGQGPSVSHENSTIEYAAGSRKGSNSKVENAHRTILDLDGSSSTSFFGVYDGHGGADVALYCANNFHRVLVNDGDYKDNLDVALKRAFTRMDEQMDQNDDWRTLANPPGVGVKLLCFPSTPPRVQGPPYVEGSTACVVLIRGNQIIIGNVGDCCCVLSRDDGRQAIVLSTKHTPEDKDERSSIENAGGQILSVGGADLVNGILPCTRAIGSFRFKPPSAGHIVTCTPDIHIEDITHDTEHLLVANRAFWDTTPISSEMAVQYVRQLSGTYSVASMCDRLLNLCRSPVDNLTLILVYFKPSTSLPRPAPPAPANLSVPVVG